MKIVEDDICGLCGKHGTDKLKHPVHWVFEEPLRMRLKRLGRVCLELVDIGLSLLPGNRVFAIRFSLLLWGKRHLSTQPIPPRYDEVYWQAMKIMEDEE